MVVKFYDLKSVIEDELTRIEQQNLDKTKEIHIEYVRPDPEMCGYYRVRIRTFDDVHWVV